MNFLHHLLIYKIFLYGDSPIHIIYKKWSWKQEFPVSRTILAAKKNQKDRI